MSDGIKLSLKNIERTFTLRGTYSPILNKSSPRSHDSQSHRRLQSGHRRVWCQDSWTLGSLDSFAAPLACQRRAKHAGSSSFLVRAIWLCCIA